MSPSRWEQLGDYSQDSAEVAEPAAQPQPEPAGCPAGAAMQGTDLSTSYPLTSNQLHKFKFPWKALRGKTSRLS